MIGVLLVFAWLGACGVRNIAVYRWRTFFLVDPIYGPMLYAKLPSYMSMVFNPWYWNRWSQKAWLEYTLGIK